ncbi:MAG: GSCFA domain-containing protein [Bacteroidetes bacterium]|nr:GSCFA domain-containing protein [Bacteroidota bacterium]
MVKFRTEFPAFKLPPLDYQHPILVAGSCFAELIEAKLRMGGFHVPVPSHGILYHPFALSTMLQTWCEIPSEWPVLENHDNRWISLDHHGSFSSFSEEEAKTGMLMARENCALALKEAHFLFLSLGTAHYFQDKVSGKAVGNCHKLPADRFIRNRSTVTEIVDSLNFTVQNLREINPQLTVILSVSPVKHLRDGLAENSLSKSILRVATDILCSQNSNVHYFPAYEILTEDLRDYRFYSEDLAHPSKAAQDYIFQYFSSACFSIDTLEVFKQVSAFRNLERHFSKSNPILHLDAVEKEKERLVVRFPFLSGRL